MAIIAGMNMTWVSRLKKTVRNKLLYMTKMFLFKPSDTGLEDRNVSGLNNIGGFLIFSGHG